MEFYVADDPFDHFPWTWQAYSQEQQTDDIPLGSINTPNGQRPDGTMHTYWSVAGDIWETDRRHHLQSGQRRGARPLRHTEPAVCLRRRAGVRMSARDDFPWLAEAWLSEDSMTQRDAALDEIDRLRDDVSKLLAKLATTEATWP